MTEKPSKEIIVNLNFPVDDGVKLKLHHHRFTSQMIHRPSAEVKLRKIVTHLIKKQKINGNIIDLGAWIGDNALAWSKNNQKHLVYAIDPSPDNCSYISELARINDISNIVVIQEAISSKKEIISTSDSLDHSTFRKNSSGRNVVQSTSLDELYNCGKIDNIKFMHLDVEGMELDVILGSSNIIKLFSPIIIFEQHTNSDPYKETCELLSKSGYASYIIPEICGAKRDCRNFIAIPESLNEILPLCLEVVPDLSKEF